MCQHGAAVPSSHVVALLLLLTAACAGGSQSPPGTADLAPAAIPAPLVSSLIRDPGDPGRIPREITVGAVPPGYPATLVPAGPVEIVGGMSRGNEVTAVFADSTRRLAAVLEEQFERVGFTRPAPPAASGFSPAWSSMSYFCNQDATVSVTQLTGAQRHHARVTYRRVGTGFRCGNAPRNEAAESLALPALTAPPGVRVSGSGGGSGGGRAESRAEVTGTGLVPADILAHYAAQLVAAGWTASEPAVSPRAAAQYFEAPGPAGHVWDGVLVAAGSDTALALTLTMRSREGR